MNTYRFCKVCKKNRVFELNPFTLHSECVECGSRFAGVLDERMLFAEEIVEHIDNRIGCLVSHKKQVNVNVKTLEIRLEELEQLKKWLLRYYKSKPQTQAKS